MYEEFLSHKIMLCLVEDVHEAISKINKYSGGHSASIVTKDIDIAEKFMNETDCAAVYHNASTRFTDGGQVGFGGCLLYTSPSPRDRTRSRMPSSA